MNDRPDNDRETDRRPDDAEGRNADRQDRLSPWQLVGSTKGRGRGDRFKEATVAVKDIYLYPLHPQFKQLLC